MLDVPMIDSIGDMLQLAIMAIDIPPKALATEIGYSVDSLYSAVKGDRAIPVKARAKLAHKSFMMACTVALEGTGLSQIFGYQKVDRHIQSMIFRVKSKDKETGGFGMICRYCCSIKKLRLICRKTNLNN